MCWSCDQCGDKKESRNELFAIDGLLICKEGCKLL